MRALVLRKFREQVIFASNLSDSQILQALSNGIRPFDIPNTGRVYWEYSMESAGVRY